MQKVTFATLLTAIGFVTLWNATVHADMIRGRTPYDNTIPLYKASEPSFYTSYDYADQAAFENDLWAVVGDCNTSSSGDVTWSEIDERVQLGEHNWQFGGIIYHFHSDLGFTGGTVSANLDNLQWDHEPIMRMATTAVEPTGGSLDRWADPAFSAFDEVIWDTPGETAYSIQQTVTLPGSLSAPVNDLWIIVEKPSGSSALGRLNWLSVTPSYVPEPTAFAILTVGAILCAMRRRR
ncbi:MAG: PEP-CTERM sorting domain-containing protein [Kiritimatiellales bacterium]|nr:PEP-CTERM sorting domain-containing protein [Kiritimatiellales bacterium]